MTSALKKIAFLGPRATFTEEALQSLCEALRLKPDFIEAHGNLPSLPETITQLTRITFDLAKPEAEAITMEPVQGAYGDMPKIDDRFAMERYHVGYMAFRDFPRMGESERRRLGVAARQLEEPLDLARAAQVVELAARGRLADHGVEKHPGSRGVPLEQGEVRVRPK